jgi:predicted nucleic-acid-binding Zn-ribbon protein
MKSGICPKCSAESVRRLNSWFSYRSVLAVGFFQTARLTHYVCGACGYHESYVERLTDLGAINERGEVVTKTGK